MSKNKGQTQPSKRGSQSKSLQCCNHAVKAFPRFIQSYLACPQPPMPNPQLLTTIGEHQKKFFQGQTKHLLEIIKSLNDKVLKANAQRSQLKNQIESAKIKPQSTNSQFSQTAQQKISSSEQIARVQNSLHIFYKEQIGKITEQKLKAQQELKKLQTQYNSLSSQKQKVNTKYAKEKKQLKKEKDQLAREKDELLKLIKEKDQMIKQNAEALRYSGYQKENALLRDNLQIQFHKRQEHIQQECRRIEQKFDKFYKDKIQFLQETNKKIQNTYEQRNQLQMQIIQRRQQQLSNKLQVVDTLVVQKYRHQSRIKELQDYFNENAIRIKVLECEKSTMAQQIQEAKKQSKDPQIQQLQSQLIISRNREHKINQQLQELRSQRNKLANINERLEQEISRKIQTQNLVMSKLSQLNVKITQSRYSQQPRRDTHDQGKDRNIIQTLTVLQEELEREKQSRVDVCKLEKELEKEKRNNMNAVSALQDFYNRKQKHLHEQLQKKKAQIQKLQQRIKQQEQLPHKEIKQLKQRKQAEIQQLREHYDVQISQLQKQMRQSQEQLHQLEMKHTKQLHEQEKQHTECIYAMKEEYTGKVQQLLRQLIAKNEQQKKLMVEIAELTKAIQCNKDEINLLEQQIKRRKQQYEETIEKYQAENQELLRGQSQREKQIRESENREHQLREQNQQIGFQLAEVTKQNQKLKKQIQDQKLMVQNLKGQKKQVSHTAEEMLQKTHKTYYEQMREKDEFILYMTEKLNKVDSSHESITSRGRTITSLFQTTQKARILMTEYKNLSSQKISKITENNKQHQQETKQLKKHIQQLMAKNEELTKHIQKTAEFMSQFKTQVNSFLKEQQNVIINSTNTKKKTDQLLHPKKATSKIYQQEFENPHAILEDDQQHQRQFLNQSQRREKGSCDISQIEAFSEEKPTYRPTQKLMEDYQKYQKNKPLLKERNSYDRNKGLIQAEGIKQTQSQEYEDADDIGDQLKYEEIDIKDGYDISIVQSKKGRSWMKAHNQSFNNEENDKNMENVLQSLPNRIIDADQAPLSRSKDQAKNEDKL